MVKRLYKSGYAFHDKMDTDGVNHYKRMFDITDGLIRRGLLGRGHRIDPWREFPQGVGTNLERLKLTVARRPLGIINSRC